jgi:ribosomal protein S18 acetylase RimI-like enzyme
MTESVSYRVSAATAGEIAAHLRACDSMFEPALSARVEIDGYAGKIASQAIRFEAWAGGRLIGLVAVYANDRERGLAFITNVSIHGDWTGRGIAMRLMHDCAEYAKLQKMRGIDLEVASSQRAAIGLYEKCGFTAAAVHGASLSMHLDLETAEYR